MPTVTKISSLPALGTSPNGGSFLAVSQLVGPDYVLYKVTVSELLGTTITSLNGLTASSQTFATPGTSGTAPSWSSSGSAHTLNIPLASASGVTAGLLSKAQYDAGIAPFLATQTQNRVLASPDGSSGVLSVRALTNTDLPTILPGKGGTGTTTAFTAGSIVFAGGSGVYTQDNTNLYYNDTDNWLHANKLMLNTTYTGDPYSFVHKSVDSVYHFKFIDSSSNTIIASQAGNLYISESSAIRSTGTSLTFVLNSDDGEGINFNTLGGTGGIFVGDNIFLSLSPTIRSVSTATQKGININHTVEQSSIATGKIESFSASIEQEPNLTRAFNGTIGASFLTISDIRGTTGISVGNTLTGPGIPALTTVISILGNDIHLSNNLTTTVTGALLTNTSVTYSATDIADYRSFSSIVGISDTQKAFYAEDTSSNLLFAIGGDGSFTFKGGTYAPADTGWTDTSTNYAELKDLAFNLSTVTASDANFRLLARAFLTLEIALKDKGIILA